MVKPIRLLHGSTTRGAIQSLFINTSTARLLARRASTVSTNPSNFIVNDIVAQGRVASAEREASLTPSLERATRIFSKLSSLNLTRPSSTWSLFDAGAPLHDRSSRRPLTECGLADPRLEVGQDFDVRETNHAGCRAGLVRVGLNLVAL